MKWGFNKYGQYVYGRDVSLSAYEDTSNLVVNGDFSDQESSWACTSGISATFNNYKQVVIEDGAYHLNVHWERISGSGNSWPALYQTNYTAIAGVPYNLSCQIRINSQSGTPAQVRFSAVSNDYWTPGKPVWDFGGKELGVWHDVSLTRTFLDDYSNASHPGALLNPRFELYSGNLEVAGEYVDFDIRFIQIEQKDHKTPFVNGSREDGRILCSSTIDDATIYRARVVPLQGTATSSSTLSASILAAKKLAGSLSSLSSLSSIIQMSIASSGTISATSATSAVIANAKKLVSATTSTSTVHNATIALFASIVGASSTSSVVSATIANAKKLSGSLNSASSLSSVISMSIARSGTITATSTTSATIANAKKLSASATSTSTVSSATIALHANLTSSSVSSSSLSANIIGEFSIHGGNRCPKSVAEAKVLGYHVSSSYPTFSWFRTYAKSFTETTDLTSISIEEAKKYDFIIADGYVWSIPPNVMSVLKTFVDAGISVIATGNDTRTNLFVTSYTATAHVAHESIVSSDLPFDPGVSTITGSGDLYGGIDALVPEAYPVYRRADTNQITGYIYEGTDGAILFFDQEGLSVINLFQRIFEYAIRTLPTDITTSVSATISKDAKLVGSTGSSSSLSATIANAISRSGTVSATSALNASLSNAIPVNGSLSTASSLNATIKGYFALSSLVSATSSVALATIANSCALLGQSASISELVAIAQMAMSIVGTAQSNSNVSATIANAKKLSGVISSNSSNFSIIISNAMALSGSIVATSDELPQMIWGEMVWGQSKWSGKDAVISRTRTNLISGSLLAQSTVGATIEGNFEISGNIDSHSDESGVISCESALSGSIIANSDVSSEIEGHFSITGYSESNSELIADTLLQISLTGAILSATTVQDANILGSFALLGSSQSTSMVQGSLSAKSALSGAVSSYATVDDTNIEGSFILEGSVDAYSQLASSILGYFALSGQIISNSSLLSTIAKSSKLLGSIEAVSTITDAEIAMRAELSGEIRSVTPGDVIYGQFNWGQFNWTGEGVTITRSRNVPLSGSATSSSSLSSAISASGLLLGSITAATTLTANILNHMDLSSSVEAVSGLDATVAVLMNITGHIFVESGLIYYDISNRGVLDGSIETSSSVSATSQVSSKLSGYIESHSDSVATVKMSIELVGATNSYSELELDTTIYIYPKLEGVFNQSIDLFGEFRSVVPVLCTLAKNLYVRGNSINELIMTGIHVASTPFIVTMPTIKLIGDHVYLIAVSGSKSNISVIGDFEVTKDSSGISSKAGNILGEYILKQVI